MVGRARRVGAGLRWKGSRVAISVLYYYRGHEWLLSQEGGGRFMVEGSRLALYVLYYCRGHEWLPEPGGWGRV